MDKKKVKELITEVYGIIGGFIIDDDAPFKEKLQNARITLIEALKEFEKPGVTNLKVYVVIERPLDTVTMASDIGSIHVTSNAEKAIDYYLKGENCSIVIKDLEE